ncbi:hypothetical protein BH11CYA1_BH11CYA1_08870 [soil metagenome]
MTRKPPHHLRSLSDRVKKIAAKAAITMILAEIFLCATVAAKETVPTSISETAIVYEQQSKVLGRCQIIVSKAGTRLDWLSKNVSLITHPPEWRMTMLNTAEHKYFTAAPGRFRASSSITVSLCRTSDTSILKPVRTVKALLCGRAVNKISMTGEPPLKSGYRHWQKLLLHSAEYWVEPTTIIPPPVVRSLQEMYCTPTADGIPLQLTTVSNKGKVEKELILLSAKTRTVSDKEFAIPEKYKAVEAQEKLLTDGNSVDFLQLMPQR